MTAAPNGRGYWFTAADGGVFAFGDARFYGSLGSVPQRRPIVAITADRSGNGYWFTNTNGAVTAYGGATYWGSAPQVLNHPVVGMAEATGSGNFSGSSYPSGSYGYDISNFQCGNLPPSPHTIGLVEVVGESKGSTNRCLGSEAAWAAGGLNLYIYLTYGQDADSGDPACQTTASPAACNYGFDTALDAFAKAGRGRGQHLGGLVARRRARHPGGPAVVVQPRSQRLRGGREPSTGSTSRASTGWASTPAPGTGRASWAPTTRRPCPTGRPTGTINPATTCGNVHSLYAGLPQGPGRDRPVQLAQLPPIRLGGMSTGVRRRLRLLTDRLSAGHRIA